MKMMKKIQTETEIPATLKMRGKKIVEALGSSHCFVFVMFSPDAVGYIILEKNPHFPAFIIYELFVIEDLRRRGYGKSMIQFAEEYGKSKGETHLFLWPYHVDNKTTDAYLREWYSKLGFKDARNEPGGLEKELIYRPG